MKAGAGRGDGGACNSGTSSSDDEKADGDTDSACSGDDNSSDGNTGGISATRAAANATNATNSAITEITESRTCD